MVYPSIAKACANSELCFRLRRVLHCQVQLRLEVPFRHRKETFAQHKKKKKKRSKTADKSAPDMFDFFPPFAWNKCLNSQVHNKTSEAVETLTFPASVRAGGCVIKQWLVIASVTCFHIRNTCIIESYIALWLHYVSKFCFVLWSRGDVDDTRSGILFGFLSSVTPKCHLREREKRKELEAGRLTRYTSGLLPCSWGEREWGTKRRKAENMMSATQTVHTDNCLALESVEVGCWIWRSDSETVRAGISDQQFSERCEVKMKVSSVWLEYQT